MLPFSTETNDVIASKISDQTVLMADRYISTNQWDLIDYNIVITGTVGAGKSTLCESLVHVLKCINPALPVITYPEFLFIGDEGLSLKLLEKKIVGDVSMNTFQSYVLDNWEHIMTANQQHSHGIRIFERCIDDCVMCFANIENKNANVSDIQLFSLYKKLKQLVKKFDIPTYLSCKPPRMNSHFTKIRSGDLNYNLQQVISIIGSDILNGVKNRIIGLSVNAETSMDRMRSRARDGESGYSTSQIEMYTNHYERLFQMLDSDERIKRFVDIGKLI